jgi:hypothetical protein
MQRQDPLFLLCSTLTSLGYGYFLSPRKVLTLCIPRKYTHIQIYPFCLAILQEKRGSMPLACISTAHFAETKPFRRHNRSRCFVRTNQMWEIVGKTTYQTCWDNCLWLLYELIKGPFKGQKFVRINKWGYRLRHRPKGQKTAETRGILRRSAAPTAFLRISILVYI